jgi:GTP pyrophosphokinase
MVAERAPSRDQFLAEVVEQVEQDLKAPRSRRPVTGRPKHYYSIYQKMIVGGREFSDIYDLVGIRILVERTATATRASGVLHSRLEPGARAVQGLRRDAEVQHVPVAAHDGHRPAGQAGRVQIRTFAMHRRAEYGVAAHWKYKENSSAASTPTDSATRTTCTWAAPAARLAERGRRTRASSWSPCASRSTSSEVYVFTPRGDVIALPSGATPVDFAYAVHTEVGHHTIGSRVNGRLVPAGVDARQRRRRRGLHLEVADVGPVARLADFVKSPRARSKIRQWFTKERREEAIERGKDQIAKLMRKEGCPSSG